MGNNNMAAQDISEQIMENLRRAKTQSTPSSREIIETILRPVAEEIWQKVQDKEYRMAPNEFKLFVFFELEFRIIKSCIVEAALMRSYLSLLAKEQQWCRTQGHLKKGFERCYCSRVKMFWLNILRNRF